MRAFEYRGPDLLGVAMPGPGEILTVATPGNWYKPTPTETIYGIAKRAYGTATPGIYRLNDSVWNSYIRKGTKGWEAYAKSGKLPPGNVGIQLENKYSNNPLRSPHGSGTNRPILWIPPFDSSEPPEDEKKKPSDPFIPSGPQPEPTKPDEPKKPGIPFFGPFIPSSPSPETLPPELTPKPDKPSKPKAPSKPRTPSKPKAPSKPGAKRPGAKKPGAKKPGAQPPKVKIVPVQVPVPVRVPYPVKEKRNEWSPWLVGGIALALGLVVADNRNVRR